MFLYKVKNMTYVFKVKSITSEIVGTIHKNEIILCIDEGDDIKGENWNSTKFCLTRFGTCFVPTTNLNKITS